MANKKGCGCSTLFYVIIVVALLMSCTNGNNSSSSSSSGSNSSSSSSSTASSESTADYNNRESKYIDSLVGEWMFMQSNGSEVHFIFNADQSGYIWLDDNEPHPMNYRVANVNDTGTKASVFCDQTTSTTNYIFDTTNSANGTIQYIEYELWHPGDR
jgi:hypothetical protein